MVLTLRWSRTPISLMLSPLPISWKTSISLVCQGLKGRFGGDFRAINKSGKDLVSHFFAGINAALPDLPNGLDDGFGGLLLHDIAFGAGPQSAFGIE